MKLFELSGLVKPLDKRRFEIIDSDPIKIVTSDDLPELDAKDIVTIKYMKPGELRTVKGITLKRVDTE